ncbi:HDIG domain-containing metalloprotein [Desulfohalobium retbaense]|uniref:Metal dependent phosphohydrolase n=1 Tax=Desulfohalobium retbaense (strain ATCC 49708 / DSM 5692 / JCM 16813 / HR100) TaxID=485915 RepID=C8X4N5_DESRD|nr:HDIG domain-containing metalloprotein [Desulfohalobium retbaense]ACV69258.1 metal dependent phosphohydrolase [Desulfohalobium retbaense DSM 5692]
MFNREQALALLKEHTSEEHLLHHALETEAVMRHLARELGEDETVWGLTGLVHDIDYAQTKETPEQHGVLGAQMVADHLPDEALQAIRAHNSEMTGVAATTRLDFALRCGETVTGLVRASALVRPNKMEGLKPKSLKKKIKDKSFAANVSRERLAECDRIGLEQGAFLQLAITAVQEIAPEVGLE